MPLAPVTGKLATFARRSMPADMEPRLSFVPRFPGTSDGYLFTRDRVPAYLSAGGDFAVELEETGAVTPAGFHYIAEVTYFLGGKPKATDSFYRNPIYVPPGGGELSKFPGFEFTGVEAWVSEEKPPVDSKAFVWYKPESPLGEIWVWED